MFYDQPRCFGPYGTSVYDISGGIGQPRPVRACLVAASQRPSERAVARLVTALAQKTVKKRLKTVVVVVQRGSTLRFQPEISLFSEVLRKTV